MKTKKQIKKEIEALKTVRPKVRLHSMFGDDNLAALDAQIEVLENNWDGNDIYDKYDHADFSEYILESALDARQWIDDLLTEVDSLAEDWPLEENS